MRTAAFPPPTITTDLESLGITVKRRNSPNTDTVYRILTVLQIVIHGGVGIGSLQTGFKDLQCSGSSAYILRKQTDKLRRINRYRLYRSSEHLLDCILGRMREFHVSLFGKTLLDHCVFAFALTHAERTAVTHSLPFCQLLQMNLAG